MTLIPDYITSYQSADRPTDVAEALNKAAEAGDEYRVMQRADGRWIILYVCNDVVVGPL